MRWGLAFIWITVAAFVAAIFSELLGWHAVRSALLIVWVTLLLLVLMTRGMRWTSVLAFLSSAALLGGVISEAEGAMSFPDWFLLAWAVLLLPVAIGLFSHPMRTPAWGLFVGFWGVVGVLWLIVLQILVVARLLAGGDYGWWAAWPLALIGIWILVASSLGFGAERFPRWVDALGLLAGASMLGISLSAWSGVSNDLVLVVGRVAPVAYCLWAVGLGWVFWGTQHVTHRFRGLAIKPAT
jgi:hypothetical protein